MADKVKKKSTLSTVLSYIYLIGAFALIFLGPKVYHKKNITNRDRACYSNLRVLLGAVEMYNMDSETMMTTLDQSLLRKWHYIKADKDLECPEVSKQAFYSGKNLTDDGEIICSYHGGLIAEGPHDKIEEKNFQPQKYFGECLERIPYALFWPLALVGLVLHIFHIIP
ncbi:MAG: hypothetical protein IKO19_02780 [Candidatus Riflebacteria bacterium]|nr:hypothetical protein [Candidatus Riflebacteria bacterium]MBR4569581.1 hypothetical protein [Candidatus Riflebacteria bacterium]